MSGWSVESSEDALEFMSDEYNRLEAFQEGLGERFFESVEKIYQRVKINPWEFEAKTAIYRKALVSVSRKLQYLVYFRVAENHVYVDLILPASTNPERHPSD